MRVIGCVLLLIAVLSLPALAQDNFSRAAREIEADLARAEMEQKALAQQIEQERAGLTEKLGTLQAELAGAKETLALKQARIDELKETRVNIIDSMVAEKRIMRDLAASIHEYARDLQTLSEVSPATAEDPEMLAVLKQMQDSELVPDIAAIARLVEISFDDMAASSQILLNQGMLVNRDGLEVSGHWLRLGHMTAMYGLGEEYGYLALSPTSGRLLAAEQPSWWVRRSLAAYQQGEGETVYMDVSGGVAIRQLAMRSTLKEQILKGGVLVWPILLVGAAAIILILERLFFLGRVRQNTDELMARVTGLVTEGDYKAALKEAEAQAGRPTGNVLKAGLLQKGQNREVIESSLSEAMVRETPRLERFIPALRVLAAVAPLLGLLGTVTGMINTFHVITMHGSSEPRLMAGGISEALITTQLGLAVAIPIMVATALLSRRAQNLAADMEEKALALTAALLRT